MLNDLTRRTLLIHIAIVFAVVVALYSRVTQNDYVDLDDTSLIVNNYPFIKDFSNVPQAFKQGIFQEVGKQDTLKSYYRPIMELSFMIDANLSPVKDNEHISAKPFLRSNILYHLLACILLLLLFNALGVNCSTSLLLTLLFAVHPILLQAIAWIPGRNDSLVTIFICASFLMLIRFLESGKPYYMVFLWLIFTIALFTKENALLFPIVALFYMAFVRREGTSLKTYLAIFAGQAVIISQWYLLRQYALAHNDANDSIGEMVRNLATNLPMFFQYIGKSVIPYGFSVMSTTQDTNYIVGIAAIALITAGIILSKEKRMPVILFGLLWFFIFLTPSFFSLFSGLEHRDYLPLIGLLIVVSEFDFVKKLQFKSSPPANARALAASVGLIVVFAVITYSREPIFLNAYNFDKDAIETSKHAVLPCLYMAKHYEEVGDYEDAIGVYKTALEREPNGYMIHNSMGTDYILFNKPDEAQAEFKKELEFHPKNTLAMFNLGLFNLNSGKDSVAEALGKQSITIDPQFIKGYELLAAVQLHKGDTISALPYIKWLQDRGIQFPPPPGQ